MISMKSQLARLGLLLTLPLSGPIIFLFIWLQYVQLLVISCVVVVIAELILLKWLSDFILLYNPLEHCWYLTVSSLAFALLGLYTAMSALITYCNAITQAISVFTDMESNANPAALAVPTNWIHGSQEFALIGLLAAVLSLFLAVSQFCVLVSCPSCFGGDNSVSYASVPIISIPMSNDQNHLKFALKTTAPQPSYSSF